MTSAQLHTIDTAHDEDDGKTGLQLVTIQPADAMAIFTAPDRLARILDALAADARSVVPDVSTKRGRDAIVSLAYKVQQSKTHIDGAGKALVDDLKALPKKIDANRKKARDFLDDLRAEIRAPLVAYEAEREAERKAELAKLAQLEAEAAAALALEIEHAHELALLMNAAFDRDAADRAAARERERAARDEQIKADAIAAAKAEMMRQQQAQQAADAARAADLENRKRVNLAALDDLIAVAGLDECQAKAVIIAIARGNIRNIRINY